MYVTAVAINVHSVYSCSMLWMVCFTKMQSIKTVQCTTNYSLKRKLQPRMVCFVMVNNFSPVVLDTPTLILRTRLSLCLLVEIFPEKRVQYTHSLNYSGECD